MLKLIAPFRVLFKLDSSLVTMQPEKYHDFLLKAQRSLDDRQSEFSAAIHHALEVKVNIHNTLRHGEGTSRYASLDASGSLYMSPQVFTLQFSPAELEQIATFIQGAALECDQAVAPYSMLFRPSMSSLTITINDNSIAILCLDLMLNEGALPDTSEHAWDKLDQWTTRLINSLLSFLHPRYVYPFLKALTKFCHRDGLRFVLDTPDNNLVLDMIGSSEHSGTPMQQQFMLMWVNRTLLLHEGTSINNNWVQHATRQQGILRLSRAHLHLNWGNNLVVLPSTMVHSHLAVLWNTMMLVQYFYAAMDVVGVNLVKYISITFNKQTSKTLRRVSGDMEQIVNLVTILQVRYKDTSMEMQGSGRDIFHHLEREWNFPSLVANVQMKLDLCKGNLTRLQQETNNRNQGRTEIVLTALAGVGILSLMVGLSTYASQIRPENEYMIGRIPGFMDLGFIVSHNMLGWIGIFFSVAIVMFSIKNRRS